MKKNAFILAVIAACLFSGCEKSSFNELFLESGNLSLWINDSVIFEYDPLTCQIAYDPGSMQFRVQNDNVSQYYILTCNSIPAEEDQSIKASLKWCTSSKVSSKGSLEYKVKKIDEYGRIWLWNSKNAIAVSVQMLD